jgi:Pyruvate/2-oxoacid:ferredoxin oxidoreductase delta subunit
LFQLARLVQANDTLEVRHGRCEECAMERTLAVWRRNRDRLRATLVALGQSPDRLRERRADPAAAGGAADLARRSFLAVLWARRDGSAELESLKRLADAHPGSRREVPGTGFAKPSLFEGCDRCDRCAEVCPTAALRTDRGAYAFDPLACPPGCRLCLEACPRHCLEMQPAAGPPHLVRIEPVPVTQASP